MAPGAGSKRKRGDRTWSTDSANDGSRPSPHRPGSLHLAQQYAYSSSFNSGHQSDNRGRGGRRGSRGGRGGGNVRSPVASSSMAMPQRPTLNASKSMSPPLAPYHPQQSVNSSATPTPIVRIDKRPPTPRSPTMPYNYQCITEERVHAWKDTGRKEIVNESINARSNNDAVSLGSIFQELIRAGLDERIDPGEVGNIIRDILNQDCVPASSVEKDDILERPAELDVQSLFLDNLSIITDYNTSHPNLKSLVFATGISADLLRRELEMPLLQSLGLVRDTFSRMAIRHSTKSLYRQSNYNLLREESEGYSKLMTELYTTSSNEPPSGEVVQDTFERVKAMIGAFDLDVGRVLDVTLDVFAAVLVKRCPFFVKFLRVSSWWPKEKSQSQNSLDQYTGLPNWALPSSSTWTTSHEQRLVNMQRKEELDHRFWNRVREVGFKAFFEIGRRSPPLDMEVDHESLSTGEEKDQKWIEVTGTLPPRGNRVAAQLLGFKLRFYASEARDPTDVLPSNLIYLAALLIKIGFISLRDLYPHLWPSDEDMNTVKEEKMKEKAEREKASRPGGGAMNALMMAGALVDDTLPPPRLRELDSHRVTPSRSEAESEKHTPSAPREEEDKDKLPDPVDQKVQLLRSLLAIGAIPESLYILGRFPWLLDAFPDLSDHLHRILHHCLSKIYEPLQPLQDKLELTDSKKVAELDQNGMPKGCIRRTRLASRRVLRWAQLDKDDANEGIDYRFYWDDWNDCVPVCQSVDDVFLLCDTLVNFSGVKIGQDPLLLTKLVRIGKHSLTEDSSPGNKSRWQGLLRRLVLPALSLTKNNPGVINETYDLLEIFPTDVRYAIYAEWYGGQISRLPDMKVAFDQARAETKDVMKRISKTNTRPMARALAKVAYSSPGVVFNVAISQIESYPNLVGVVVECARYFTYLGYDVLNWSLMNSLGQNRSRVQADGMLTSLWLKSLSEFVGSVLKRYSVMSPGPILQYVAEQLRRDNATDLIVLEQIVRAMGGIVPEATFNDAQVQAMAGGELLQAQIMLQLDDRRHESAITSRRLMRALTEKKLAGRLLISIAQHRQTCVYKVPENDAHLKLLGNVFDRIHYVLAQYLDLLRSNLSVNEFNQQVPDVIELMSDFGLEPATAFWLARPSISQEIAEVDAEIKSQKRLQKETTEPSENKNEGKENESLKLDGNASDASSEGLVDGDTEMKDDGETPVAVSAPETPLPSDTSQTHPVLNRLVEGIQTILPSETWSTISASFYVTFWQLSLYDMLIPGKSYEEEIERQKKKVVEIAKDRSDASMAGHQRREREKKACNDLQQSLLEENKRHLKAYGITRQRLQKDKDLWFSSFWQKFDLLNESLIQNCFLPRILLSPMDALYSFKMLKYLHTSGTRNFRTMGFIDHLLRAPKLKALIFACTSREAENLGRFLKDLLKDLDRWHSDKSIYQKDAFGFKRDLPGFAKKINHDGSVEEFLDYEEFRRLLFKWHRILSNTLRDCLRGGEYMHIRNAIIMLKSVQPHFPAVNFMGEDQIKSLDSLAKNEVREDLKVLANSLLPDLRKREKQWVLPHVFNLIDPSKVSNSSNQRSVSARPAPPPKILNPTAPEFEPSAQSIIISKDSGNSQSQKPDAEDGEDGEIEDVKMSDASIVAEPVKEIVENDKNEESSSAYKESPPHSTGAESTKPEEDDGRRVEDDVASSDNIPSSKLSTTSEKSGGPVRFQPELHRREPEGPSFQQNGLSRTDMTNRAPLPLPRSQHSLPSRPDTRPPRSYENRLTSMPMDHPRRDPRDLRDPRDVRGNDHGRLERPNSINHERQPLHSNSYEMRTDRPSFPDRDRFESQRNKEWSPEEYRGRPREMRPPSREAELSDRPPLRFRSSHDHLPNLRTPEKQIPSRDIPMPPPRQSAPVHIDRAVNMTHPDRVALLNENGEYRRDARREPDDRRPRNSQPTSPNRQESRSLSRYDERQSRGERMQFEDRRHQRDPTYTSHIRTDEAPPLPNGPRNERLPPQTTRDHEREQTRPTQQSIGSKDINHGRLNQESTFGRLQEPQQTLNPNTMDIPQGPRGRNGARGRGGQMNPPSVTTQRGRPPSSQAPLSSLGGSDRQPPTGPSAAIAGNIHPDRLKALQQSPSGENPRYPSQSSHHHNQMNSNSAQPIAPPLPPSGPRNSQVSNSVQSSSIRNAPPGPSYSNDRLLRGGPDKRFAGIQNVLQQSSNEPNNRGTSIRGRANRQNVMNMHTSSVSGPPTANTSQPFDTSHVQGRLDRSDLFANRSSGNNMQQQQVPRPRHQSQVHDDEQASLSRTSRSRAENSETPHDRSDRSRGDRTRERELIDASLSVRRSTRRGTGSFRVNEVDDLSRPHSQDRNNSSGRWENEASTPRSSRDRRQHGGESGREGREDRERERERGDRDRERDREKDRDRDKDREGRSRRGEGREGREGRKERGERSGRDEGYERERERRGGNMLGMDEERMYGSGGGSSGSGRKRGRGVDDGVGSEGKRPRRNA